MTTFDPDWTEDDISAALVWLHDEDDRCTGCGLPRSETFDPERANAYTAEAWACHACAARAKAERAFREGKGDVDGVYFPVRER